jgi:signal peptidase II
LFSGEELGLCFSVLKWNLNSTKISPVLGGDISNLMDRFMHGGRVVDFMNVGLGSLRTCIFNIADMIIMAGIRLLCVLLLRSLNSSE